MKTLVAGFLLAAGMACAQNQPKFEVPSIKPSNSADRRLLFNIQPGVGESPSQLSTERYPRCALSIR